MAGHGEVEASFSPFVLACFAVNYIVGTGFLCLPWAFERAGILLTIFGMTLVCASANISSDYLLTAMARADAISKFLENGSADEEDMIGNDSAPLIAATPLQDREDKKPKQYGAIVVKELPSSEPLVCDRKFEITDLCRIFLGPSGSKIYTTAIIMYIYGLLWAYSSVFASAMAKSVTLGLSDTDLYPYYLVLFACIVVPMSFLELSEQVSLQIFLSGCRFLMIFLMVATPLMATFMSSWNEEGDEKPYFGEQSHPAGNSPWVRLDGIHQMIPVVVYSCVFHQSIPGLTEEMKDKKQLGTVLGMTFGIVGVAYSLLGVIVAWYFGEGVAQSANLNWVGYHSILFSGTTVGGWLASAISFYVVCFPALDVVSAFPLNAFCLGNELMGTIYNGRMELVEENKNIKSFFRLLSSLPPIIGAFFVRELGTITDYTGISGLAVAYCFPALLYIYSERVLSQHGLPSKTHYERFGSSKIWSYGILVFGILAMAYVLVSLIQE